MWRIMHCRMRYAIFEIFTLAVQVFGVSRTDYAAQAAEIGAAFYTCMDDFAEQHPDVVILATSILSTRSVLEKLPLLRFRRSTLFVDVLSVKVFPKQLLLGELPETMDILCTHPMFGPDSGKGSWAGLNFQYEQVRVSPGKERATRVDRFLEVRLPRAAMDTSIRTELTPLHAPACARTLLQLVRLNRKVAYISHTVQIFRSEGCNMVEMSCEQHDQLAANTQFITHTVGRILGAMNLGSTPINTRGYESLLNLVENTANDSFELYYGLFMYNQVRHSYAVARCRVQPDVDLCDLLGIFTVHNCSYEAGESSRAGSWQFLSGCCHCRTPLTPWRR
jgi:arogenate dehydrogenase (NADP+), plant